MMNKNPMGMILSIENFRLHDGNGIRTAVFLKGCHLCCPWCANPESQKPAPQLGVHHNLCTRCGLCVDACPREAIYIIGTNLLLNEARCNACGECVPKCPHNARQLYGGYQSVEQVMREIEKDRVYYSRSGGGVVITGGEPLLQPDFVRALSLRCRGEIIDTTIETSGYVPWNRLWTACEYIDTILLDLKTLDLHRMARMFPAGTNLEEMELLYRGNVKQLVKMGKQIILRCPILPGFNDDMVHIAQVVRFVKEHNIQRVDLLAFHQYGSYKYGSLNKKYPFKDVPAVQEDSLGEMRQHILKSGIDCEIGG